MKWFFIIALNHCWRYNKKSFHFWSKSKQKTNRNFTGCQIPHCMMVLILYINFSKLSWIKKCLFLRNMEPLRGLDTLGRISAIFPRKTTFVTSCLLSCAISPFWSPLRGKNLLPYESKLFPFRVDPFSEGEQKLFWQSCLPCKIFIPHNLVV